MSVEIVPDSSALVALLADSGSAGQWAAEAVAGARLSVPALAGFEVANVLRRRAAAGDLSHEQATLCHADLQALPLHPWPYELLAARAWELRSNLTIYDAAYVALAERLGAALVTLDQRLARAPGPRCTIEVYGAAKRR